MKIAAFEAFELTDDITHVRELLTPNIAMLKNQLFVFDLVISFVEKYDKPGDALGKILDWAESLKTEKNNSWEQNIDKIMAGIENNKFQINFYYAFIVELLYALGANSKNNDILEELLKKLNRRYITTHQFENEDFLTPERPSNPDYNYLFVLTLRQIQLLDLPAFLEHHHSEHGAGFLHYLMLTVMDYQHLLTEKSVQIIQAWIEATKQKAASLLQAPQETDNGNKINWLGTQKELGELFVELHKKGWIAEINHKQITRAFTKSNTISQVLKPSQDNRSLENMYEQIYTSKYEPKFDTIRAKKGKK